MPIERRAFLATSLALLASAQSRAADQPPPMPYQGTPPWPAKESFPLWPGKAPGQRDTLPNPDWTMNGPAGQRELHIEGVAKPEIHVYRPKHPTGQGLVVFPGGSYRLLSVQNEGLDAAHRFNEMGMTIFILTYRLPNEGWDHQSDVPLQDGQRAMRLIRSKASDFGIDPAKLAVLGFSAGGHAAATLTTCFAEKVYQPVDSIDQLSARPAFSCLMYPVIDLRPPLAHLESRTNLLGPDPSDALLDARSPNHRVTADTPPCFLAHALDDDTVPYGNSVAMIEALRAQKIPCELHLFEKGNHGFGFHLPKDFTGSHWPELFRAWMRQR
ncbi:MAG TPA: alpha/beta hydrolase [Dongiaceae bacterium]